MHVVNRSSAARTHSILLCKSIVCAVTVESFVDKTTSLKLMIQNVSFGQQRLPINALIMSELHQMSCKISLHSINSPLQKKPHFFHIIIYLFQMNLISYKYMLCLPNVRLFSVVTISIYLLLLLADSC